MMNNFDITAIEDEVREIVRGLKVSTKVYANRPKATESASDFVVVSATGGINDLACYGEGTIVVSLFAKDNDHFKNGKKLSVMYNKLIEGFPASSGKLLFDTEIVDEIEFGYRTSQRNTSTAGDVEVADFKVATPLFITPLESGDRVEVTDYDRTYWGSVVKKMSFNLGSNIWFNEVRG